MTSPQFERTFYLNDYKSALFFVAAQWGVIAVSVGFLFLSPQIKNPNLRWAILSGGFLSSIMGSVMSRGAQLNQGRSQDVDDMSDQMLNQQLYVEQMAPVPPPKRFIQEKVEEKTIAAHKPSVMPLLDILKRAGDGTALTPHILILGATGKGKTLLAEWLMDADRTLHNSTAVYVSPTVNYIEELDSFEFLGSDMVGCGWTADGEVYGMQYTKMSSYMSSLYGEVYSRYQRKSVADLPFYNVCFDEMKSSAKSKEFKCKKPDGSILSGGEAIFEMATISRKKKIRLIVMTHIETVAALNISGEGDLRENFTYVRMGEFALKHLRTLVTLGNYTEADLAWWDANKNKHRLLMVGDDISVAPDLSNYRALKRQKWGRPEDYVPTYTLFAPYVPVVSTTQTAGANAPSQLPAASITNSNISPANISNPNISKPNSTIAQLLQPTNITGANITGANIKGEAIKVGQALPNLINTEEELLYYWRMERNAGASMSSVLKKWGYRSKEAYARGKLLWDKI